MRLAAEHEIDAKAARDEVARVTANEEVARINVASSIAKCFGLPDLFLFYRLGRWHQMAPGALVRGTRGSGCRNRPCSG